jgi:hypothetical protein
MNTGGKNQKSLGVLGRNRPGHCGAERKFATTQNATAGRKSGRVHAGPVCTMRGQMKRKEKIRPGGAQDNEQLNVLPTGADWSRGAKLPLN